MLKIYEKTYKTIFPTITTRGGPHALIQSEGYPDYHTWLAGLPPTPATADCWIGTNTITCGWKGSPLIQTS